MIKGYPGTYYGSYRQIKFTDAWMSADNFVAEWSQADVPTTISAASAKTLYYLLYARHGNDIIASSDTTRFKYCVYSLIFQYGGVWEKKLELQEKLRALSDDELQRGTTQINNRANHDGTEPQTDDLQLIPGVDEQLATIYKKDKMNAYSTLYELLDDTITERFLKKFDNLFLKCVSPELPLLYGDENYD